MKKLIISGNLGKDSKLHPGEESKRSYLTFSVAVRDWDSKKKEEVTDWIECTLFGERAEKAQQWLVKGVKVIVEGKLQIPNIWKDDNGNSRCNSKMIVSEYELCGSKKEKESEEKPAAAAPAAPFNDDVPF